MVAMRDAERRATAEQESRREVLEEAKKDRQRAAAALAACTENCHGLRRALNAAAQNEVVATQRYSAAVQAVTLLADARSRLTKQIYTFFSVIDRSSPGSQTAAAYRDRLQDYLAAGNVAGRTQQVGSSGSGEGSSSYAAASQSSSVSLADVVDDRPGPPHFEKVSREHVEWGLDVLIRVIEPALRLGKGPDYFTDRDRAEGLSGERSYNGVHNWFYNPDQAIKLSRLPDGRLDVTNGYHRIYVARQLGLRNLPARVR